MLVDYCQLGALRLLSQKPGKVGGSRVWFCVLRNTYFYNLSSIFWELYICNLQRMLTSKVAKRWRFWKTNTKELIAGAKIFFLQTFRSIDKFITQKSPTYACVYGLTLLPNKAFVHSMKIDQVTVIVTLQIYSYFYFWCQYNINT